MSDQTPPPGPQDPNDPSIPPPPPPPPPGWGYGTPGAPGPGAPGGMGGYGAPPPGYGMPAYGAAPVGNKKALWSLITGIASLVCCGIILGIVAIVLGQQAKDEIRASGGMQTGEGQAQAGVVIGIIGLVLSIISIPIILSMQR